MELIWYKLLFFVIIGLFHIFFPRYCMPMLNFGDIIHDALARVLGLVIIISGILWFIKDIVFM